MSLDLFHGPHKSFFSFTHTVVLIMLFVLTRYCCCFFGGLGTPGSATTVSDGVNQTGPGAAERACELWGDIHRRLLCRLHHPTRRMGKKTLFNFHALFKAYFEA